jgi:hypothetical protein
MSEVLHANIFFFITGIAVIVFSALLCVALFHIIKVLKSLRRIMDRIEEGTEVIAEDIQNVREYFTEGGFIGRFVSSLMGSSRGGASQKDHKAGKSERKKTELKIKDET